MRIFLSVSYSSKVDATGRVLADYRADLEEIITILEQDGHIVFCGPREDGWKLNDASPADAFQLDVIHINGCDVLVAFVTKSISAGIQLELGYAYAKGKQIILATSEPLVYINEGLVGVGAASLLSYKSATELAEKLNGLFPKTQR